MKRNLTDEPTRRIHHHRDRSASQTSRRAPHKSTGPPHVTVSASGEVGVVEVGAVEGVVEAGEGEGPAGLVGAGRAVAGEDLRVLLVVEEDGAGAAAAGGVVDVHQRRDGVVVHVVVGGGGGGMARVFAGPLRGRKGRSGVARAERGRRARWWGAPAAVPWMGATRRPRLHIKLCLCPPSSGDLCVAFVVCHEFFCFVFNFIYLFSLFFLE